MNKSKYMKHLINKRFTNFESIKYILYSQKFELSILVKHRIKKIMLMNLIIPIINTFTISRLGTFMNNFIMSAPIDSVSINVFQSKFHLWK